MAFDQSDPLGKKKNKLGEIDPNQIRKGGGALDKWVGGEGAEGETMDSVGVGYAPSKPFVPDEDSLIDGEYVMSNTDLAYERNRDILQSDPTDTTEEEAYVNQRILDDLGGQQNDARARMGRAGFGASGALAGMEMDQQRAANMDASGQIYDLREREQNQGFDQLMGVQEMDIRQQEAASRAARDEGYLGLAQDLANPEQAPSDSPGYDEDGDDVISPEEAAAGLAERDNARRGRHTNDETMGGGEAPGVATNPYGSNVGEREDLEASGFEFTPTGETGPFGLKLYTDQDGNYWYFDGEQGWW